jgi:hypothetical protein
MPHLLPLADRVAPRLRRRGRVLRGLLRRAPGRAAPFGRTAVRLANGRRGRFTPLSCGASCSPPQIQWRERGATYAIQADVGTPRTLVRMANEAIRSGPR